MADTISVIIGAQIEGLLAGIAEAKAAIEGLNPAVAAITDGLSGVAEAIGAGFVVGKIEEFAEQIGETAHRVEVLSEVLGTTPQIVQELAGEFEIFTGQAELPARAMEVLANNLVSGMKRAQNAIRDFGISQADAARMTHDWQFAIERLAQAWQEGEPGMARTADLVALVGRRHAEDLIPVLDKSREQMEEARKAAEEYGAVLSGPQLQAMQQEHDAVDRLKTAWDGLVKQTMAAVAKSFTDLINELTLVVHGIETLVTWLQSLDKWFDQVDLAIKRAGNSLGNFIRGLWGGEQIPAPTGEPPAERPPGTRHLAGPGGGGRERAGKKESDDRMQQWRDELRTQLEDEKHFFADSKQEELNFWQAKLALVQGGTKDDIKLRREINTEIYNLEKQLAKQTEQNRLEEIDYQEKVNNVLLDRKKAQIEADYNLGKISQQREIALEKELVDEKMKADEDYYHRKEAAAEGDVKTIKKLEEQEYLDHEKNVSQKIALDNKSAEEIHKTATTTAEGISGALSGALTGIITGRQTIGQAGRQLGEEAMSKIMDTVMDKTVGRLIQNAIENLLQQLLGDAANTGILASLLAAILAKPSVAGTTFGMGGIVPGAAGGGVPGAAGGWVIPSFQSGGILAQLHGGEMVLPRDISEGMQGIIRGGGGGGSTINIHAMDTQTGAQFLMRNAGSVGQAALRYSNVSPRAVSSGGARFP